MDEYVDYKDYKQLRSKVKKPRKVFDTATLATGLETKGIDGMRSNSTRHRNKLNGTRPHGQDEVSRGRDTGSVATKSTFLRLIQCGDDNLVSASDNSYDYDDDMSSVTDTHYTYRKGAQKSISYQQSKRDAPRSQKKYFDDRSLNETPQSKDQEKSKKRTNKPKNNKDNLYDEESCSKENAHQREQTSIKKTRFNTHEDHHRSPLQSLASVRENNSSVTSSKKNIRTSEVRSFQQKYADASSVRSRNISEYEEGEDKCNSFSAYSQSNRSSNSNAKDEEMRAAMTSAAYDICESRALADPSTVAYLEEKRRIMPISYARTANKVSEYSDLSVKDDNKSSYSADRFSSSDKDPSCLSSGYSVVEKDGSFETVSNFSSSYVINGKNSYQSPSTASSEYDWSIIAVSAASSIIESGGDDSIAHAVVSAVLKTHRDHGSTQTAQQLLNSAAVNASNAVLRVDSDQTMAAAAAVAVLRAGNCQSQSQNSETLQSGVIQGRRHKRKEDEVSHKSGSRDIRDNGGSSLTSGSKKDISRDGSRGNTISDTKKVSASVSKERSDKYPMKKHLRHDDFLPVKEIGIPLNQPDLLHAVSFLNDDDRTDLYSSSDKENAKDDNMDKKGGRINVTSFKGKFSKWIQRKKKVSNN